MTAIAGYDAHLARRRVVRDARADAGVSDLFAREAWRLLEAHYERVLAEPRDLDARGAMLLGAHYAGVAIELSMLGATHACANPLTAKYGTTHGVAIAVMLPHVVRWNARGGRGSRTRSCCARRTDADARRRLGARSSSWRAAACRARCASSARRAADIPALAADAATQWTGTLNPRPFDARAARALYERALVSGCRLGGATSLRSASCGLYV